MERRIVIGLITDTNYLRQLKDSWQPDYIESDAARTLCSWCWEYYHKYDKAPKKDIQHIFDKKVKKKKVSKDLAEEIETEILPDLSSQHTKDKKNKSLLKDTWEYFIERQFQIYSETIETFLDKGQIDEAKQYHSEFVLYEGDENSGLDLASDNVLDKIDQAFADSKPVLNFNGALGNFWNDEMTKGSLIAILAPEKRGKTFLLMFFLMEAYSQGRKVVLFQAGDMTESQQIMRFAISLAKKSNKKKFCGKQYIPVPDCIRNQTDTCNKKIRACQFGIFEPERKETLREDITYDELVEAHQNNKFYKNCFNCLKWKDSRWGTVWLEEFDTGKNPLTAKEAKKHFKKFFNKKEQVQVFTYANGELTDTKIDAVLTKLKTKEKYEPEVVLIDYGDLVESSQRGEKRHQIDHTWRKMRGMSQKYDSLWIVPTQADAKAHDQDILKIGNFSEDKRKLAHVSAMYGLNQDTGGREKKLGIIRYNKIVVREDSFHETDQVRILQRLQIGKPNLGSFW